MEPADVRNLQEKVFERLEVQAIRVQEEKENAEYNGSLSTSLIGNVAYEEGEDLTDLGATFAKLWDTEVQKENIKGIYIQPVCTVPQYTLHTFTWRSGEIWSKSNLPAEAPRFVPFSSPFLVGTMSTMLHDANHMIHKYI